MWLCQIIRVYYRCVTIPQFKYMEHGLKYITFYAQKHKAVLAICYNPLKLDVSCHLLDVYTKFQIHISKHVEKKLRKISAGAELCWVFLSTFCANQTPKQKNCPTMTKISMCKHNCSISVCTECEGSIYFFQAISEEKLLCLFLAVN